MRLRWSVLLLVPVLSGPAHAQDEMQGTLAIHQPWSRALPPVAPNGAAYFRIVNHGKAADRIVSAHSPVADRAELHTHEMKEGVMTMRRVPSAEVPAGGGLSFEPGGLHVMLLGLKQPLVEGESFPLTLEFRDAGKIEVTVKVGGGGTSGHSGHAGHRHGQTR